jgi:O-antigen/teichoic acid export membrane protein
MTLYLLDIDFKLTNNILLLVKISVIMILFNLIANDILIPLFGILGAVASTALTFLLALIFTLLLFSLKIKQYYVSI